MSVLNKAGNPVLNLARDVDEFTKAYILCALWTFDEEAPSGEYETSGRPEILWTKIADETLATMISDCAKFQADNHTLICLGVSRNDSMAGHDFWLTRNHHGSGFLDGDYWAEDTGIKLTDAAKKWSECYLYFGDDGLIYLE